MKPTERVESNVLDSKKAQVSGLAASSLMAVGCSGGNDVWEQDSAKTSEKDPDTTSKQDPDKTSEPEPEPRPTFKANKAQAARFLLQAGFSAQNSDIHDVIDSGYEHWLDTQMRRDDDTKAVDWLHAQGYNNKESRASKAPFVYMLWQQFLESKGELRKRMAFALSEIVVVSIEGVFVSHRSFAMAKYWDLLNKHAFGNYRDLLEDITLNPAMGQFLSTRGNRNGILAKTSSPDENYARELLQLFTIGLVELNIDGTAKKDANGNEIETYSLNDITQLSHVFTGWGFDWDKNTLPDKNTTPVIEPMTLVPKYHSTLAINVFNTHIPANTDARTKLTMALDEIFSHPNVAPFISKQLIQRLVTSNPSPAYVERVARVFNDNGKGVKGDLGATLKAILLDNNAREDSSLNDANFGKIREPAIRLFQCAKTFNATSVSGKWQGSNFGHPIYGFTQAPMSAPSVFNFFRPGYVPTGSELGKKNLTAPELQIINETTTAAYYNNLAHLLRHDIGHYKNWRELEIKLDYSEFEGLARSSVGTLIDELNLRLTANQLSDETLTLIKDTVNNMKSSTDEDVLNRIKAAIYLIMSSYDYLLQK